MGRLIARIENLEKRYAPAEDGEMKAHRDAALRMLGVDPDTIQFAPKGKSALLPGEGLADYFTRRIDEIEARR